MFLVKEKGRTSKIPLFELILKIHFENFKASLEFYDNSLLLKPSQPFFF